jgi:hypothetical protein
MQTLHTVLGMPLVLIPASDASRKLGKWPFTLLLREHLGHSRTAAVTKLNNDVKMRQVTFEKWFNVLHTT